MTKQEADRVTFSTISWGSAGSAGRVSMLGRCWTEAVVDPPLGHRWRLVIVCGVDLLKTGCMHAARSPEAQPTHRQSSGPCNGVRRIRCTHRSTTKNVIWLKYNGSPRPQKVFFIRLFIPLSCACSYLRPPRTLRISKSHLVLHQCLVALGAAMGDSVSPAPDFMSPFSYPPPPPLSLHTRNGTIIHA